MVIANDFFVMFLKRRIIQIEILMSPTFIKAHFHLEESTRVHEILYTLSGVDYDETIVGTHNELQIIFVFIASQLKDMQVVKAGRRQILAGLASSHSRGRNSLLGGDCTLNLNQVFVDVIQCNH